MNQIITVVSFALAVLVGSAAIFMGPDPEMFFNMPSILVTFLVPAMIMLAMYGKEAFVFHKLDQKRKIEIAGAWDHLVMSCGVFFALVGFVQIGMQAFNPKSFGIAVAIGMLTIVYAYAFRIFVLFPLSGGQLKAIKIRND